MSWVSRGAQWHRLPSSPVPGVQGVPVFFVAVEPWLLFACGWEGSTLGLIGQEDWPVRGRPYGAEYALGLWCLPQSALRCVLG